MLVDKFKFDKLFYIFVLLCKQWQFGIIKQKNKSLLSLLDLDVILVSFWRKFFYIYFLKLLNFNKIFFYINFNKFLNFDFSNLYTLYMVECLFYNVRLFPFNSSYFINNFKNLFDYSKFKLRLPFFWYATLNNYSEHFRFIKYQEYIKNLHLDKTSYVKLVNKNKKGNKFVISKQSLTERYRFNLMSDAYLFYNSSIGHFKHYYKCLDLKLRNLFQYQFLILQSFYFLNNLLLDCCLIMFKDYFKLWIFRFIYKFFMQYGAKFLLRFQYKDVFHFVDYFVTIRFDYSKHILWHYYKKLYLTIFEKINIKEFFNKSILNHSWLSVINIALYKLIHEVFYLRVLDQFDRDMVTPLTPLFLALWYLFVEWCYLDISLLDLPYMKLDRFNIWIDLFKYNLENICCTILNAKLLNSNFLNLKSLNSMIGINKAYNLIKYSNNCFYNLFLKKKMLNIRKSIIIFNCFQIISLFNKLICCSINLNQYTYRQLKLLQYNEMLLNNSNIIFFFKLKKYSEFCKFNINEYDVDVIKIL